MLEKEINKEDINIIHWHIFREKLRCFFEYQNSFYELYSILTIQYSNLVDGSDIIKISAEEESIVNETNIVIKILLEYRKEWKNVSLNQILSDSDTIMTSSPEFLKRVKPFIRQEKINQIIYGK